MATEKMMKLAAEEFVLAFAVLESGEAIRVHATKMAVPAAVRDPFLPDPVPDHPGLPGPPRRPPDHPTKESALAAFWKRVGEGKGEVLKGEV